MKNLSEKFPRKSDVISFQWRKSAYTSKEQKLRNFLATNTPEKLFKFFIFYKKKILPENNHNLTFKNKTKFLI